MFKNEAINTVTNIIIVFFVVLWNTTNNNNNSIFLNIGIFYCKNIVFKKKLVSAFLSLNICVCDLHVW